VAPRRTISKSKEPSLGLISLVDGEVSKKETAVEVVEQALKHFGRIDLRQQCRNSYSEGFHDYTEENEDDNL